MKDMVTHMPDRYKIVETLIQHVRKRTRADTHTLIDISQMIGGEVVNISASFIQGMWFFTEELDKDEKVCLILLFLSIVFFSKI